jgi:hypothetical protein
MAATNTWDRIDFLRKNGVFKKDAAQVMKDALNQVFLLRTLLTFYHKDDYATVELDRPSVEGIEEITCIF